MLKAEKDEVAVQLEAAQAQSKALQGEKEALLQALAGKRCVLWICVCLDASAG